MEADAFVKLLIQLFVCLFLLGPPHAIIGQMSFKRNVKVTEVGYTSLQWQKKSYEIKWRPKSSQELLDCETAEDFNTEMRRD